MPNHVENIIEVTGEDSTRVIDELFDENDKVTFNKFAPMPKGLEGTTSPSRIVSQKEYDEEVEKRDKLIENPINNGAYIPSLPLTQKMSDKLIKECGSNNWYDWAIENWGTKWGGYDGEKNSESSCYFQTAWSTPYKAMVLLSKKFPNAKIRVQFADEDFGSNVGEYTLLNGVDIDINIPKNGSVEALRMAIEISGGEYHLNDYIPDCYDEEGFAKLVKGDFEEDKYVEMLLEMILENEIIPYQAYLQKHLTIMAIKTEQFEYALRLKEYMDRES